MFDGLLIDFCFSAQLDSEYIPDVSVESPLCVSGKYRGKFPETVIAKGNLADMTEISIELKVQHVKDMPLDKVRCPNLLLCTFVLRVTSFAVHWCTCTMSLLNFMKMISLRLKLY